MDQKKSFDLSLTEMPQELVNSFLNVLNLNTRPKEERPLNFTELPPELHNEIKQYLPIYSQRKLAKVIPLNDIPEPVAPKYLSFFPNIRNRLKEIPPVLEYTLVYIIYVIMEEYEAKIEPHFSRLQHLLDVVRVSNTANTTGMDVIDDSNFEFLLNKPLWVDLTDTLNRILETIIPDREIVNDLNYEELQDVLDRRFPDLKRFIDHLGNSILGLILDHLEEYTLDGLYDLIEENSRFRFLENYLP